MYIIIIIIIIIILTRPTQNVPTVLSVRVSEPTSASQVISEGEVSVFLYTNIKKGGKNAKTQPHVWTANEVGRVCCDICRDVMTTIGAFK